MRSTEGDPCLFQCITLRKTRRKPLRLFFFDDHVKTVKEQFDLKGM